MGDDEPELRRGKLKSWAVVQTMVLNAALAVLVGWFMVGGLEEADSWRDGELFLAPATIALGISAIVVAIAGLAAGVTALRSDNKGAPLVRVGWSVGAAVVALVLSCLWLFLVFVSASSD